MNPVGKHQASERARSRRSWPVRILPLDAEAGDLQLETSAEDRLEMMWPLALEAWALTGRPLPEYSRAECPVRRAGSLGSRARSRLP